MLDQFVPAMIPALVRFRTSTTAMTCRRGSTVHSAVVGEHVPEKFVATAIPLRRIWPGAGWQNTTTVSASRRAVRRRNSVPLRNTSWNRANTVSPLKSRGRAAGKMRLKVFKSVTWDIVLLLQKTRKGPFRSSPVKEKRLSGENGVTRSARRAAFAARTGAVDGLDLRRRQCAVVEGELVDLALEVELVALYVLVGVVPAEP